MILVFHIENREVDFYSGHSLDMDDVVKVCRNFGVERLVLINETQEPIKILDQDFNWSEYRTLEDFENDFNGDVFYLETPWQKPAKNIDKVILKGKALVIGPTRGLLNKGNYLNVCQEGIDAFYPKDLIPIVCYENYRQWQR